MYETMHSTSIRALFILLPTDFSLSVSPLSDVASACSNLDLGEPAPPGGLCPHVVAGFVRSLVV